MVTDRSLAGISAQIYALRGGTSGAFGDFAALGAFARKAGRWGFDAVMTSPTHALFGADHACFSPYAPSTRFFFNPVFADATLEGASPRADLNSSDPIDWPAAGIAKRLQLRSAYDHFRARSHRGNFERFCHRGGRRLLTHALFEALDLRFRAEGIREARRWPAAFRSPAASGVRAFAREAREQIEYQLFLQWLVARSADAAQKSARRTMAIGIIADIAVGIDPQGSHAWATPQELLCGLHVGAPPDIYSPQGQDWGLTALSPRALKASAYAPFVATLRAAMRHAGGVRIDHAMGLRRLWLVPAGAVASEGVYLRFPQRELLSLVALESQLHRAIVIGEDLGTVPDGFRDELAAAGVAGMQVLWFERDRAGRFLAPRKWRGDAVATTTTHDLPTVAGWWSERDIDWQARTRTLRKDEARQRGERAADRQRLWSAFKRAKCATGSAPAAQAADATIAAALRYVGRTRCKLAFAPIEDVAGDREQANLPGTVDEHPNWRRRLKTGDLLRDPSARARLQAFIAARRAT